jgi:S1-C subfamily serine protease
LRNGRERTIPVTLIKLETFEIDDLGLEVKNATPSELRARNVSNGVLVTRPLSNEMAQYDLSGIIITKINDENIENIDDVKRIMNRRDYNTPIKMTFVDKQGQLNSFIFR